MPPKKGTKKPAAASAESKGKYSPINLIYLNLFTAGAKETTPKAPAKKAAPKTAAKKVAEPVMAPVEDQQPIIEVSDFWMFNQKLNCIIF